MYLDHEKGFTSVLHNTSSYFGSNGFLVLASCQFEDYWFNRSMTGEQFRKEGNGSHQSVTA